MRLKNFDIVKEGKKEIAKIKDAYPEIEGLADIKHSLGLVKELTPDEVSRAASEMAGLLVRLGEAVAEATGNANESYAFRQYSHIWEFQKLSLDLTAKERDNKAIDEVYDHRKDELVKRYVADILTGYYKDYSRYISTLQSRIKVLSAQMFNVNLDDN